MKNMKYADILKRNKQLAQGVQGPPYKIRILSNIVTFQLNDILEYSLRSENINPKVTSGNYDTIVQDSAYVGGDNLIIIFWELANCVDGFQYKANLLSNEEQISFIEKMKKEIDFVFNNLSDVSLVLFNTFSTLAFNGFFIEETPFDIICGKLNGYMREKCTNNIILIDIDKVIAQTGIEKSIDLRYYYSSKALYSIEFYKNYTNFIVPIIRSANGRAKKALIFDCDNTLWHGVLGEDGPQGIELSAQSRNGVPFEEVQVLARYMNQHGVLIGLCSKNNEQDIKKLFENNPSMQLAEANISIQKINWLDKASNLRQMAQELNIGLDSFVMIDDSAFEVEYLRHSIPELTVLQVPDKLYEYPSLLRRNTGLFFNVSSAPEDIHKPHMYAQQVKRYEAKQAFTNLNDYLVSLNISITVFIDDCSIIPRVSQLTQKTNQFNLTTKRYTDNDIHIFINSPEYHVFAIEVTDRFGTSGITGICIVSITDIKASIDTLLLSCRVLGRNVELAFIDAVVEALKDDGIEFLEGHYIASSKNQQVKDFYSMLGWCCVYHNETTSTYAVDINDYKPVSPDYIEVKRCVIK